MVTKDQNEILLKREAGDKTKFVGIEGEISSHNLLQILDDDLFICYKIKHLFVVKHSCEKYTDEDESYRKMLDLSYPTDQEWEQLVKFVQ